MPGYSIATERLDPQNPATGRVAYDFDLTDSARRVMQIAPPPAVLAIRDLRLAFRGAGGDSEVLHGVSLHVNVGEKVALVGESGSGKSVTARLAMGLLQGGRGVRVSGSILFTGVEVVRGGPEIAALRGNRVTMIFQDPTSALNPTYTIRNQFRRALRSPNPPLPEREANAATDPPLPHL